VTIIFPPNPIDSARMPSGGVRTVSENLITTPPIQETLNQLLALLGEILQHKDHKDLYTDMAGRLSAIARKDPAWGWRYVQSVASGTVQPSKRFARAVDALAVTSRTARRSLCTRRPARSPRARWSWPDRSGAPRPPAA
jgi:hypothetical protein